MEINVCLIVGSGSTPGDALINSQCSIILCLEVTHCPTIAVTIKKPDAKA